ncbi:MAG: hypothetical protein D6731_16485, partial [Planctomycetota bacterium]
RSLTLDPAAPSTFTVGTKQGVYRSLDGGATWFPYADGMPPGQEVRALAVDPLLGGQLYAGAQNTVYSSTGNNPWLPCSTGLTNFDVKALAQDPLDPSVLYAGTKRGVFRSTDGGATWTVASAGLTNLDVKSLAVDPTAPGTIYAGTKGGVFRSTDGGATWTSASVGLTNLDVKSLAVDPTAPGTIYAGTKGGVFESTDGGATWAPHGLAGLDVKALLVDPVTLYAGTKQGVFCRERERIKVIASGAWSNPTDWTPSGVPVASDVVVVKGPVAMDATGTVARMSLTAAADLVFQPGKALTVTQRVHVAGGRLAVGSAGSQLVSEGPLTVSSSGRLDLAGGGALRLGTGGPSLLVWGSLSAVASGGARPSIDRAGTNGSTDVRILPGGSLSLNGASVAHGGPQGLFVSSGARIDRLRDVAFGAIDASPGAAFLTIEASSLNLNAPGLSFADVAPGQFNVVLRDTGGAPGDVVLNLEFRGVAVNGAGAGSAFSQELGGASVNWVWAAPDTTRGKRHLGFPQVAYDLNTFALYATYVGFHDVDAAGTDRIHRFDALGAGVDEGTWFDVDAAFGDVVGSPWWDTLPSGAHVLWLTTDAGYLLRFTDPGAGAGSVAPDLGPLKVADAFASGPITDGVNVYVAGTVAGAGNLLGFDQATGAGVLAVPVPAPPRSELASEVVNGVTMLYAGSDVVGGVAHLYRVDTFTGLVDLDNTSPRGAVTTMPTVAFGLGLFVGDDAGWVHGVDQLTMTNLDSLHAPPVSPGWPVPLAGAPVTASVTVAWYSDGRVYVGDGAGRVYAIESTGAVVPGYPVLPPGLSGQAIVGAPLEDAGLLWVADADGRLVGLDVSAQTQVSAFRFGAGLLQSVVSQEFAVGHPMITNDAGKFLVVGRVLDPTP